MSGRLSRLRRSMIKKPFAVPPTQPSDDVANWSHVRSPSEVEVAQAWRELLEHPALQWVPPMWRGNPSTGATRIHAVRAIERNLVVEISDVGSRFAVSLCTGPLVDRRLPDGVDPVTPAGAVDPALTVTGATFEQAVVKLRDAVVHSYGSGEDTHSSQRGQLTGSVPDGHEYGASRRLRSTY